MSFRVLFCTLFFISLAACHGKSDKNDYAEEKARAPFEAAVSSGVIEESSLDEISGIVASQKYPGFYWVHNDSGGSPSVYLIDSLAQLKAEVRLEGVINRDWEDIAIGPAPEGGYLLYVGEIGDNRATYGNYSIYTFPEPELNLADGVQSLSISDFSTFQFQYPDGARDAETLLVDPTNRDIIVISKRGDNVIVYHWPFAEQSSKPYVLRKVGGIPFWMIVSGDISPDGQELLLKNYESIFYWKKEPGVPWLEAIKTNPHRLPYQPEPQGEAVAFTANGQGYVTLSEGKNFNGPQHIYFYRRKQLIK
jgi:hypothetical protein